MAELNKLIAVVGPTASGKTAFGIELCKKLNGEVVSCDSMQIYQDMDIATAMPDSSQLETVPHHMLNFLSPIQSYNVSDYCNAAGDCINNIISRGKQPILVGGTGLYFDSLINGIKFSGTEISEILRKNLSILYENDNGVSLLKRLWQIDEKSAEKLHCNDKKRIIRAFEVYYLTGKTKSESDYISKDVVKKYNTSIIVLDVKNRNYLYERINNRVDEMIRNGLVDEAKAFFDKYSESKTAAQAIGYKELKPYLYGDISFDEAIEKLKQSTRNYAKRQLSWFHRYKDCVTVYIDEKFNLDEIISNL